MLKLFMENNLILSNQSGYKPGGSCINQLLSIAHEIYKSLDCGYDVRGGFLVNLEAFDKIPHNGVFFNLKQHRICDNFWMILQGH